MGRGDEGRMAKERRKGERRKGIYSYGEEERKNAGTRDKMRLVIKRVERRGWRDCLKVNVLP